MVDACPPAWGAFAPRLGEDLLPGLASVCSPAWGMSGNTNKRREENHGEDLARGEEEPRTEAQGTQGKKEEENQYGLRS